MELTTPLYERHIALKGKIVPFAGYLMPVQFSGVIEEHMAVRTSAGLFDVSHMGEVLLSGPDALKNLNALLTNDFTNLAINGVRYSMICNEQGGVVDDVLVNRLEEDAYMIVVNASNRKKDIAFLQSHVQGSVSLADVSDNIALLALQGPKSRDILIKLANEDELPEKYYTIAQARMVGGIRCTISRTGYTGEFGYELYCPAADGLVLWDMLLEAGKEEGLIPCGLGARDTLRLEAGMPLYGHEMDDDITPFETGLGFCVKMKKEDFIGKSALIARGEPKITRVGLKLTGRGVAREHCDVYYNGEHVGKTTSGTHCPYLGGAYAMALLDKKASEIGAAVEIDVRGRRIGAEIVALPFIKK